MPKRRISVFRLSFAAGLLFVAAIPSALGQNGKGTHPEGVPRPAAVTAAPASPIASAAATPLTAPPATHNAASTSSSRSADGGSLQRFTIRFDDHLAALTPSGSRAFDKAVALARAGQKVEIMIEGCELGADFSDGSPCARRSRSIKHLLIERGIVDAHHPVISR